MEIQELKNSLTETMSEIKSAVEKRDAEVKQYGEVTDRTAKQLTETTERLDSIKADFDGVNGRLEKMELDRQKIMAGYESAKSLGEEFVSSDVFAEMAEKGRATGSAYRVNKTISGLAASAGALVRPDRRPDVIVPPQRPINIRDLIPTVATSSNAVEVMRENVFTNNAGPQEPSSANTAIGAGEFQAKSQSNITYELLTVPVRTMAHFVPASRQVLTDANLLQGLINNRLIRGLLLESDAQLLYGDGTNQNLTGLMVDSDVSDIGEIAAGTSAGALASAMLDHIRAAVTECQTNEFYDVNGVVLNPVDFATLETAKGSDGQYVWVSVAAGGEPRLWRVPVIVSNAMAEGQFILGDWTSGSTIYDREQLDIRVSESHSDFFVKNGVAILAEERYGFGIERPKAYAKGSFAVASE